MKGIIEKFSGGANRVMIWLKWLLIALLVILVDLTVILENDLPDWIGLVTIILFLYIFLRRSKMTAVVFDLLLFAVIFAVSAVKNNGLEGCQQMLYDFYLNTGSKIIAYAIVIGIGYAMWKSRKK